VALGCALGGCARPAAHPEHPGLGSRIAFDYHPLSDADLDYLSRFDVVVTHDLADPKTVGRLKSAGAKLFFYEWLPGFYYTRAPGPWERRVHRLRRQWTLDPEDNDPDPMGKKFGCKDYFYDMANEELLAQRVEELAAKAKNGGYDGIFFDWGSGWYALKENGYRFATEAFERRHPGIRYDDRVGAFLGMLRAKGLYIALNGAFRSDGAQLDRYADLDIVESMFTSDQCRPPEAAVAAPAKAGQAGQAGEAAAGESRATEAAADEAAAGIAGAGAADRAGCQTSFTALPRALELATRLPLKARAVNPGLRFLFLNYALPRHRASGEIRAEEKVSAKEIDRQALYYGLALSYLGGASGFTCGPDVSLAFTRDAIFLKDLGAPLGPLRSLNNGSYLRLFAKGFVAAGERRTRLEVEVPAGVRYVWDPYLSRKLGVSRGRVQLELTPENHPPETANPMGRIYLYEY
jgi:hypothetical protein